MKLYQLADQYNVLLDTEDKTDEEIVEHLDNIREQFKDKVVNIGKIILTLKAEGKAVECELARLSARKKTLEHKTEWLELYLLDNMVVANLNKVEGDVLSVNVRKNPPSVKVLDESLIPSLYRKIIPESWQVDKKSIIADFVSTGELVPGVEIVTTNKHLEVK